MTVAISGDSAKVEELVAAYAEIKAGQRGIDAYRWFVSMLRGVPGSESVAVLGPATFAVLTLVADSAVLHGLQGELEAGGDVISAARSYAGSASFRGLALPGDRMTKNLFEEARLPAQMLLH